MTIKNPSSSTFPKQITGVEFEEAVDGLVGYQGVEGNVCYLNPSAALILSLCNGSLSVEQIAAVVAKAFSLQNLPIDDVERSLNELKKAALIEWASCEQGILEEG